ncbi:dienelactone hydrolase family protein [Chitinasiproducens palmae]|uniref:dienelactone hydrolase family protein n=1 Tax=Chitinasiproducens palmae TaxID=1770053 RepID=UPI000B85DEF7|nr:dienelactone hydrolase family protein [Chitinasiproducens palmae]
MHTEWIDIDNGFQGFLALPEAGPGPGIVLLQEIFGVNASIQSIARAYAADGFTVLAPDVFWRAEPRVELGYDDAARQRGIELMQKTDLQQATGDVGKAVDTLRRRPEVTGKVAVIGYCYGGLLAYKAAAHTSADAAVAYYGGGIQNHLADAAQLDKPILFHFGEQDSHIPLSAVGAIKERFAGRGNAAVHIYPDAEHGFNASARSSYQQRAAALAHGRTLVFLDEALQ